MKQSTLKAPFPYFGGKRLAAEIVWSRLGDVSNYIEPFCGSAAMLLCRPHAPRIETVNDYDCYVANFWRSTSIDPEAVAQYADWPVNEADLHARHRWLVLSDAAEFRRRMRTDPDYYDCRVAGWWCWGLCCWIGSGWCSLTNEAGAAEWEQRPDLAGWNGGGDGSRGVQAKPPADWEQRPNINKVGNGLHASMPDLSAERGAAGRGVNGNDAIGTCEARRAWLLEWFHRLRDRLRTVRVCCGDWKRVCDSPSVTTRLGLTGIFLDPPYSTEAGRDMNLYAHESGTVAHDVRQWCLERGDDPRLRIALCGYEGEGHEVMEEHGWRVIAWKSHGGYGNRTEAGKENASRERIWFSPHCIEPERERMLF